MKEGHLMRQTTVRARVKLQKPASITLWAIIAYSANEAAILATRLKVNTFKWDYFSFSLSLMPSAGTFEDYM